MKKIGTYLGLVFLLSSVGYVLVINSRAWDLNPFVCMFYLMWCPALAGLITCLVHEKNLKSIGWGPGKLKWLGLAYLLPIVYAALAYGFIWLAGYGAIDPAYQFNFIKLVIFGTLFNVAFAAGEEIGWRGFLVPQVHKYVNFAATCLIVGLIWSVWHFPLIISGVYLAKMPMLTQLILLVVTVTAMNFPISWLRLKSGSVWPAVLMHASHNLYIQRLFDPLTTETGPLSKFMIGESGIVLAIIFVALAALFWSLRKMLPPTLVVNGRKFGWQD
jgi:membrane protease YdiL (CAAX protease family)